MKELIIDGGRRTTLVDDDVYEWASKKRWFSKDNGYVFRWEKKTAIFLHREILGKSSGDIDHKDRNKSNNTRANLRFCNRSQNLANMAKSKRTSTSQYKGVYWGRQAKRWIAQISYKEKGIVLRKHFKEELPAAHQYNEWAKTIYGEFAKMNEVIL